MSSFDLDRLRAGVRPFRLHWFSRLRSTNEHAATLRRRGRLYAPAIVLTSHQIAGRGRGSNTWWSGAGSLTVTFVLPVHEHSLPHQIPLIAGLAVRNALARHCGIDEVQLKWPNDLLLAAKKLAGLLCERVDRIDLIGLGLNVNVSPKDVPRSLRPRVTSLREITGLTFDTTAVLIDLAAGLYRGLSRRDEPPFAQILRDYDRHHALVGRDVRVNGLPEEKPVTGTCVGLDKIGRLLIRHKSGVSHVIAGQVTLL